MENILDAIDIPQVHKTLGGEVLAWSKETGELTVQYQAIPEFLNPAENLQGGMLCAMIDDAMGLLSLLVNEKMFSVTVGLNISYLRPCKLGAVQVTVECIKNGQKIMNLVGNAYQHGKCVAQATSVFMPIETDRPIGRR